MKSWLRKVKSGTRFKMNKFNWSVDSEFYLRFCVLRSVSVESSECIWREFGEKLFRNRKCIPAKERGRGQRWRMEMIKFWR